MRTQLNLVSDKPKHVATDFDISYMHM